MAAFWGQTIQVWMVCIEACPTLEYLIKARNKMDELRKENPSKP
jgi:hypothetical protein